MTINIKISNSERNIILSRIEAIELELKLNVSKNVKNWRHIGDTLFNFRNSQESAVLYVNEEQYNFLEALNKRNSWRECKDFCLICI